MYVIFVNCYPQSEVKKYEVLGFLLFNIWYTHWNTKIPSVTMNQLKLDILSRLYFRKLYIFHWNGPVRHQQIILFKGVSRFNGEKERHGCICSSIQNGNPFNPQVYWLANEDTIAPLTPLAEM